MQLNKLRLLSKDCLFQSKIFFNIFREKFKPKQAYSPKGDIRPLFVNMTTFTATSGRSPLCSLLYPTTKDRQT